MYSVRVGKAFDMALQFDEQVRAPHVQIVQTLTVLLLA